jgi:hypothetical protein
MDLLSDDTRLRLANIEAKLADQQAQNAQMLDALNNTLGLLAGMTQNQNSPLPTYFQGRRAVDDYLNNFRDLISDSGYSDLKTIVVKFRRGLNPAIADAVATMAAGRPDDLDPEAWYEAAIRIDQNQAANAAFTMWPPSRNP